jgi:hypothetical protein
MSTYMVNRFILNAWYGVCPSVCYVLYIHLVSIGRSHVHSGCFYTHTRRHKHTCRHIILRAKYAISKIGYNVSPQLNFVHTLIRTAHTHTSAITLNDCIVQRVFDLVIQTPSSHTVMVLSLTALKI